MRYRVKEKLPEYNRIVVAFDTSGNEYVTFRAEEQKNDWSWELSGEKFVPVEWEYIDVELDENDARCPLGIAMEKYYKEKVEGE